MLEGGNQPDPWGIGKLSLEDLVTEWPHIVDLGDHVSPAALLIEALAKSEEE